jgi:hypothetical protein
LKFRKRMPINANSVITSSYMYLINHKKLYVILCPTHFKCFQDTGVEPLCEGHPLDLLILSLII